MKRYYSYILFLSLVFTALKGQTISFTPSKDTFEIGEPISIHYELTLTNPDSVKPLTTTGVPLPNHVELVEEQQLQEVQRIQQTAKFNKTIIIAGYEQGYYTIPPFAVATNGLDTIYTPKTKIHIGEFVITSGDFKDIKPIERPELLWTDYWVEIALTLLVLGFSVLVYFIYKRWKVNQEKRKLEQVFSVKYQITPYEECLNTLKKLEDDKLWQQNYHKLHYSILTEALKKYLSVVYKIKATEATTTELMVLLKETPMSERAIEQLKRILDNADLIKFANDNVTDQMHTLLLSSAIQFVGTDMNN